MKRSLQTETSKNKSVKLDLSLYLQPVENDKLPPSTPLHTLLENIRERLDNDTHADNGVYTIIKGEISNRMLCSVPFCIQIESSMLGENLLYSLVPFSVENGCEWADYSNTTLQYDDNNGLNLSLLSEYVEKDSDIVIDLDERNSDLLNNRRLFQLTTLHYRDGERVKSEATSDTLRSIILEGAGYKSLIASLKSIKSLHLTLLDNIQEGSTFKDHVEIMYRFLECDNETLIKMYPHLKDAGYFSESLKVFINSIDACINESITFDFNEDSQDEDYRESSSSDSSSDESLGLYDSDE